MMGRYYYLICYDCREQFCLGKAVCFDENDRPIPWQFEAFTQGSHWVDGGDVAQIVGRFLLKHRNHEIRVMVESFNTAIDGDDESVYRHLGEDISFEDYLKEPLEPEPDPYFEWENFPTAEAERLWRKVMAPESLPRDDRRGFTWEEDVKRLRRQYLSRKGTERGKSSK